MRPLGHVEVWARPAPVSRRLDRTFLVSRGGEVAVVAGRWPPPSATGVLTGRIIYPRGAYIAAAAIGPRVGPRRRSAFAGIGVAAGILGLGLIVGLTGQPTQGAVDAWSATGPQAAGPAVLPSGPAAEFVYPILPAPGGVPQMPTGPIDLGLAYTGPGLVSPVVPLPVPLLTTPPTPLPTTGGLGAGQGGGGGSEGGADDDSGGATTGQTSTTTQPSTRPSSTTSSPSTPTTAPPTTPPFSVMRVELGAEPLPPVAGDGLPDILLGPGAGLWSASTTAPAVVVLGTGHPSAAALLQDPAGRRFVVVHSVGLVPDGDLLFGEAVELPRADAERLLATTTAPLVLVVAIDDPAATPQVAPLVTLVEARNPEAPR